MLCFGYNPKQDLPPDHVGYMSWWSVELRATRWKRHELLPILPLHDGSGVCGWWTLCGCIPSSVNNTSVELASTVRIDL